MAEHKSSEFYSNADGRERFKFGTNPEKGALLQTIVKRITTTEEESGEDTTLFTADRRMRVLDAKMISRNDVAGNFTLKKGSGETFNAFTDTKAKGTTDDAIVAFGKLIDEYDEIDAGEDVIATSASVATTGSCIVDCVIMAMPLD